MAELQSYRLNRYFFYKLSQNSLNQKLELISLTFRKNVFYGHKYVCYIYKFICIDIISFYFQMNTFWLSKLEI